MRPKDWPLFPAKLDAISQSGRVSMWFTFPIQGKDVSLLERVNVGQALANKNGAWGGCGQNWTNTLKTLQKVLHFRCSGVQTVWCTPRPSKQRRTKYTVLALTVKWPDVTVQKYKKSTKLQKWPGPLSAPQHVICCCSHVPCAHSNIWVILQFYVKIH